MYGAAKKIGVSYRAASDFEKGIGSAVGRAAKRAFDQARTPAVIPYNDLCPEAKAAYNNIEIFARRYFGLILMPWQVEATSRIMELQASPQEEYVVINAPPGSGKSTFFTRILPAWATVRDRTIRGMIGSHTNRLAEWYTRRLKGEFERSIPVMAEAKDLKLGLALDAEVTLLGDYGRFKPDVKEVWRGDQFTVAQEGINGLLRCIFQATVFQIFQEFSLIDRAQWTQTHGYGRELPEVRHQFRVRVRGQAFTVNFLAEIVHLVFGQATFQERTSVYARRDMALEVNQIAAVFFGARTEEVVKAHFIHGGRRLEGGHVATQIHIFL